MPVLEHAIKQKNRFSCTAFGNGYIPRAAVCGGEECQKVGRQKTHKYWCYFEN